jgi:hypothetical protein
VDRLCVRGLGNILTCVCDSGSFIHSVPVHKDATYLRDRPVTMPLSKPLTFEMLKAELEKALGLPVKCDVRSDRDFLEQAMELIYE